MTVSSCIPRGRSARSPAKTLSTSSFRRAPREWLPERSVDGLLGIERKPRSAAARPEHLRVLRRHVALPEQGHAMFADRGQAVDVALHPASDIASRHRHALRLVAVRIGRTLVPAPAAVLRTGHHVHASTLGHTRHALLLRMAESLPRPAAVEATAGAGALVSTRSAVAPACLEIDAAHLSVVFETGCEARRTRAGLAVARVPGVSRIASIRRARNSAGSTRTRSSSPRSTIQHTARDAARCVVAADAARFPTRSGSGVVSAVRGRPPARKKRQANCQGSPPHRIHHVTGRSAVFPSRTPRVPDRSLPHRGSAAKARPPPRRSPACCGWRCPR